MDTYVLLPQWEAEEKAILQQHAAEERAELQEALQEAMRRRSMLQAEYEAVQA